MGKMHLVNLLDFDVFVLIKITPEEDRITFILFTNKQLAGPDAKKLHYNHTFTIQHALLLKRKINYSLHNQTGQTISHVAGKTQLNIFTIQLLPSQLN